MDKTDSLNHTSIKPIEVEDKQDAITNSEVFKTGLDQTAVGAIHLEEGQGMDRNIKVGQGMIWIIGEITGTIWEVIKGMKDKIIMEMNSGEIIEIKAMKEIGVGQMIGNLEVITEGTTEVLETIDQGHILEQVPIDIELDVLGVVSMIISWEAAK